MRRGESMTGRSGLRYTPRDVQAAPSSADRIRWIGAGVAVGWVNLAVDSGIRAGWGSIDLGAHLVAGVVLQTVVGVLIGLMALVVTEGERSLVGPVRRRWPKAGGALTVAFYGGLAAASSLSTARWVFTGEGVQGSRLASHGPAVGVAAATLAAGVVVVLFAHGRRALEKRAAHRAVALAAVLAVPAALVAYVDLTKYVALYQRLHAALEVASSVLLLASFYLLIEAAEQRRPRARALGGAVSVLGLGWAVAFVVSAGLREQVERLLAHVWRSPAYLDRSVRRVQDAEAFLSDPGRRRGLGAARMARVQERFDLVTVALAPKWDEPIVEPSGVRDQVAKLRGDRRDWSVVVFYVDTLRHDAAADPTVMPNTVAFAKRSVVFTHAYATASDTLRSLPGLVSGSYHLAPHANDLLSIVERERVPSCLFIARSASRFLNKLAPWFELDDKVVVGDYAQMDEEVWGYGADGSTSGPIVDRALEWIERRRDERFFAWLFHFDVHNWRELDEAVVDEAATRLDVPESGELNWRYRVSARLVDDALARLLRGLEDLGVADRTLVLLVSDHGEALGRHGFWVHSVLLWESLVRVPLIVHARNLRPAVVHDRVSLVDVPPTLARYLSRDVRMRGYHGEDLLSYLVPGRPPRRLPILMSATSKHSLVRVGMVDPAEPFKLVLQLEAGVAEVHDLRSADPDETNVAREQSARLMRMVGEVVRSPVFPRDPDALAH